jgi:hypothetical protein
MRSRGSRSFPKQSHMRTHVELNISLKCPNQVQITLCTKARLFSWSSSKPKIFESHIVSKGGYGDLRQVVKMAAQTDIPKKK